MGIDQNISSLIVAWWLPIAVAVTKKIVDKINGREQQLWGYILAAQKALPTATGDERFKYALELALEALPDDKKIEPDLCPVSGDGGRKMTELHSELQRDWQDPHTENRLVGSVLTAAEIANLPVFNERGKFVSCSITKSS